MNVSLHAQKDFSQALIRWYRSERRELPWRKTKDPYAIWMSEVMLQQTTVQTVCPRFTKWMADFPDISSLSRAPLRKVLKAWQGLGYYQRARNLHTAARTIMKEHRGKIPQTYEELIKLPGFGPYTAAAVLSLAFNKSYPVIDANVRRVLMRLAALKKEAHTRYDKTFLGILEPLLPVNNTGSFNQAMMELGALVCKPKNPACLRCPIHLSCKSYAEGQQEVIPKPVQRNYQKIEAVIGIIRKDSRILIQKRPSQGLFADLWEFPGGKVHLGETLQQALRRELREELDAEVTSLKYLTYVQHAYTQFQVTLHAFECQLKKPPPEQKNSRRWITLRGMHFYPLPSGSAKIVRFLENLQKSGKTDRKNS
jgi:A/G-specific adenine glycosylase